MVVKEFGSVHRNEQVGKKGFSEKQYKYLAVIIGIFLIAGFVWSNIPLAKTIPLPAKTTADVSAGPATSSLTGGQEKNVGGYTPKFNANGANIQEIGFNNIPKTIPLVAGLVIRDLKVENGYFYGYIKNTASEKRSLKTISFNYLDKNGIRTRYASEIEIQAYNSATKKNMWVGAVDLPANQEYYFRATTMKNYDTENEIKFVQIYY